MNKKIEQLLDLALSSPAAEDMSIRAKLIEDARQLDYLTVSSEDTIELVKGLRESVAENVDIDLVLKVYAMTGMTLAELFAPLMNFEAVVATGIVALSEKHKNDKD